MNHAQRIIKPPDVSNSQLEETKPEKKLTVYAYNHIEDLEHRKKLIKNHDIFVLRFGADWCGPCKKCEPDFKKIADEFNDNNCVFASENIDEDYGNYDCEINSIPLFCIYYNGKLHQEVKGTNTDIVKQTIINLKKINKK